MVRPSLKQGITAAHWLESVNAATVPETTSAVKEDFSAVTPD